MTEFEMRGLQIGDVVTHLASGPSFVVTGNYGTHVTAVRSVDIANAVEWVIKSKVASRVPGSGPG
jgi:hypothetical protein